MYTQDLSKAEFLSNQLVQDAVERRLEVIGEAVKHIPAEFKHKHNFVPWRIIAGLRDVLIHQYFGINTERIWKTVVNDLVQLKSQIQQITEASNAGRKD